MITLHSQPKITTKKRKRLGRGNGSGVGKNCGLGNKGQVKRAGKMPVGFEGGNASLMKRTPKYKGFEPRAKQNRAVLTLGRISSYFDENDVVSIETLLSKGLITNKVNDVRVINSGEYTKKLNFAKESGIYLTKGVIEVIK